MNKEEILSKVTEILKQKLENKAEGLNENSRIVEDLNADSLDLVEIVMEIDDAFGIETSDEEAEKLKTVGDIVNAIQEKKK